MDKSTQPPASKAKQSQTTPNSSEVIHNAIKRHAGLSDWDDDQIAWEVEAILKALKKNGYEIVLDKRWSI